VARVSRPHGVGLDGSRVVYRGFTDRAADCRAAAILNYLPSRLSIRWILTDTCCMSIDVCLCDSPVSDAPRRDTVT